jgi:hypothetical protein
VEVVLDREYFSIIIFGQKTFEARHLTIRKGTFKIGLYLLAFLLLFITFLFSDYVQSKRKAFELNRLVRETEIYQAHIRFFSARIEDLEKQLSRLKDFDSKIRVIANLEEKAYFIGTGGYSPSNKEQELKPEKRRKKLVQEERTD